MRAAENQKRCVISPSSGLASSDDDAITGSRAIPHFGQEPGPICRISGCIGHVYSTAAATGRAGVPAADASVNAAGFSRKRRAQPSAQK